MSIHSVKRLSSDSTHEDIITVLNEFITLANKDTETTSSSLKEIQAQQQQDDFVSLSDANIIWVILSGFIAFFMLAGFALRQMGSIQHKNALNVLFKVFSTIAITGIFFYVFGFAFAFGPSNIGNRNDRFIGSGNYGLNRTNRDGYGFFFFQFVLAAIAATILSGAIAGRVQVVGYLIVVAWFTSFVYPVVAHWAWSTSGWASAFATPALFSGNGGCGYIDYAGSGVVFLTSGIATFYGALIAGPRRGRYRVRNEMNLSFMQRTMAIMGCRVPGTVATHIPSHNMAMFTLGTMILWFGWYGFNAGQTRAFDGQNAAKAAVTTTLSACAAAVTALLLVRFVYGYFNHRVILNSAISGLVAISAGCTVVDDWASILIGIIAAFIYMAGAKAVVMLGVDDPVDAIAIYGFNGSWGALSVGIFGARNLINAAYFKDCRGWETGLQFGTQLLVTFVIFCWVTLTMVPLYLLLSFFGMWRVSPEVEDIGMDYSERWGQTAFIGLDRIPDEGPNILTQAQVRPTTATTGPTTATGTGGQPTTRDQSVASKGTGSYPGGPAEGTNPPGMVTEKNRPATPAETTAPMQNV